MKRVIILKADDWEVCYIDGKSVEQGHHIGEGYGIVTFLQKQSQLHNFELMDIVVFYADKIDEDEAGNCGRFPQEFSELKGDYSLYLK